MSKRADLLETEVDMRLITLIGVAWEKNGKLESLPDELREAFHGFLRAAYGMGYCDALREEAAGHRGELGRLTGYKVPV